MTTRPRLLRIDIRHSGGAFVLRIEPETGEPIELLATIDQLDAFADVLDDVLVDAAGEAEDGG